MAVAKGKKGGRGMGLGVWDYQTKLIYEMHKQLVPTVYYRTIFNIL